MKLILIFLSVVISMSTHLFARPSEPAGTTQSPKLMSQRILNINNWAIYCTNYGPFVNPNTDGSGGYWGGLSYNYIYGAGLWVGALAGSDTVLACGYNPSAGDHEMGPDNPYTQDYSNYATHRLSRVYLSTDPNDLAAWPLRDSLNNPIVISSQDGFSAISDENPAFTFPGEQPLPIRYYQQSFAWNYGMAGDLVIFRFTLINPNPDTLRQVYAGPYVDADIENEVSPSPNDRTSFEYTRNLTFQYQTTPEPG